MKKARNLWRDLPQGGSRYGSVLTRLFLLLCLLATTQAGWAQTFKSDYSDFSSIEGSSDKYLWIPQSVVGNSSWIAANNATTGSPKYNVFIDPATGEKSTNNSSDTFYRVKDHSSSKHLTFYLTNITSVTFYAYNSNSNKTLKVKVNNGEEQTIATTTSSSYAVSGTINNLNASQNYTIEVYNQESSSGATEIYIGAIKVTPGNTTPKSNLTNSQFAWSAASYTATIGGSNDFPDLTNSQNVDVTYSATTTAGGSTNSGVASINNSGVITLNQAGTAYINAIFAGNDTYNAKTVSYELTVNAAAATVDAPTFNPASGTIAASTNNVTVTYPSGATLYTRWSGNSGTYSATDMIAEDFKNTTGATGSQTEGTRYLYAIAVKDGVNSAITEQEYTVTCKPTLALSSTSMSLNTSDNTSATSNITATNFKSESISHSNLTYTVSSNDENVATATVNQSTGVVTVTAVGAGTATITVGNTAGGVYLAADAVTISVTVAAAANVAPSITAQPTGATYTQGDTPTALSVTATGNPTPTYQWYSNSTSSTTGASTISGATSASYTPSTSAVGTTYYYCVATNSEGTATSNIVAVTVKGAAENEPSSPATTTYASKTFLNVSGTKANGELEDGSKEFLTYGARNIGYTVKPSWYSGTNSKWDSGVTGNITGSGFLPFGSSSSYDNYTSTYGGLKLKASSSTFYVTGTTGVAIYASGSSSTSPLTKIDLTVEEVYSDGTTHAVGTTASTPTNNTLTIVEHGSVLDATKYYKVTATADNDKECHLVQIRFTKSSTTIATYDVNCTTGIEHGSISSNVAKAAEGTVVTITGTPVASYGLGTVTVTEVTSGNNVATTGTGNTRTFIMPDDNVNVTATFVSLPTISKGAEVNGSFTTSPASYAAAGTTVTVNATPNSGYSVGTITVTDGSSNSVTVTDGQFTMPNSNVTVNVTFDEAAVSAGDKWNFTTMSDADQAAYKADGTNWNTTGNSSYYYSKFQTSNTGDQTAVISTTIQQIKDLKFTRTSGGSLSAGKVRIYLPTSSADGYLNFNSSNGGLVLPSMTAGTLVTVDFNGTGSSYGIKPTNATTEGDVDITSTITSATRTTTTFKVKTDGEVTISANNSNVRIYKITVGEAVDVAEPTFSKADGSGYDGIGDLSVTVTTNETGEGTETTYWAYSKTALDRDALVAAATAAGHTGSPATISAANVNEQDITLYAVTKYETNPGQPDNVTYYSDVVSATYPYTGTVTPSVSASNINIQQGQQRTIEPTITMPDGTAFDPEHDTENPGLTTIYDYFDFTFQITDKSGNGNEQYITVDGVSGINQTPTTGGVVNTKVDNNTADPNNTATVHIVATQKSPFSGTWPFNGTSFETDVTVTVIAKTDAQTMSYWWDPQFTVPVTDDDFTLDGSVSVFNKKTITNGRMIYVKPAEGYTVYVAAGIGSSHPTVSKVSGTSKKDGVCYYEYRKNDPTDEYPDAPIDYNGIPLLIENNVFGDPSNEWTDANDNAEVKNFYLSLQAYNAAGDPEGSVVRCTFPLTNDNTKRPGNVTYDPAEADTKRNTAETVLTSGVEGAYVYGKFSSTSTSYNTPTLIQESGINGGQTNVGVFSTEVSNRKISAVQVAKNTTDNYYYIGKRSTNQYDYLFASEIEMTGKTFNTVVTDKDADMSTAEKIDIKSLISGIFYYNKDNKKDINIADSIQAHSGETAPVETKEIDRVTYSIQYFNGAGGTGVTDGTTLDGSEVTIGKHSGYVVVTATYPGGYSKKVSKRTSTTDEATATYTIYITDPSEQIPTITPNSRNFVDEQEVTVQAPETWSALYMVVDNENDPNYSATTATYYSSGDNKNCFLLNAGEYVRLTLTKTSKVRAFAFNPKASSYTIADGTAASKEVTQTYTKLMPLTAPTLSPYGTSENPHIRTVKSQTVIATTNDAVAGLEVYYTLDGSEPTPTTGEKYNGSEKITITAASTTIKAIAYDPVEGRISPVTTGVYIYTGTIAQPVFYVSTNNGSSWDTGHTSGTVTVNPSDLIKIETSASGAEIYYTMDGSTPTSGEAKVYEGAFSIVKNTTGKAIAIKDDASSPITTVEFVLAEDKEDLWEATDETTPSGKLPGSDRYVVYGKSEGNASSKAVKYLTATFGGMDAEGWSNKTIGEKTQGTPLNGVGKYSIRTNGDAWDETGAEVKNTANTLHGKTFALPAQGDFVRFEPERDGDLTIWLLQQGGLHYTDDGDFCNRFIRLRPIYMLDEQGNSIAASSMYSAARLSNNWDDLDVKSEAISEGRFGNWVSKGGSQNGVVNKFYTEGESEAIYNMYKDYLTTGGNDISAGDPIVPFEVPTGRVKTFLGTLGLNGTGYVMPSGGNVKYTFPVKGGKTYFFFGYRTKLCIRGFQFKPSNGQDVETLSNNVTMKDNTDDATSGFDNNICNVTYNRSFKANTWAGITLPFSVSRTQLQKVFGNGVDVLHLDNVTGTKINLKRHWYPMIVAGTPVLIKPTQDVSAPVFKGVHYEASSVTDIVPATGTYNMTGSFGAATLNKGDYYVSTNDGSLKYMTTSTTTGKSCRAWLTPKTPTGARSDLGVLTADAFGADEWNVAGNPQPFVASDETVVTYINGVQEDGIISNIFDGPTGIYTINGQLIRKDATSLEGLPKGIYIVNGKKVAVK